MEYIINFSFKTRAKKGKDGVKETHDQIHVLMMYI